MDSFPSILISIPPWVAEIKINQTNKQLINEEKAWQGFHIEREE